MIIKSLLIDFVSSFLLVLVVASIVTYLWNLIFHAVGAVDWETSIHLAIIFGIVLPLTKARERKQKSEAS